MTDCISRETVFDFSVPIRYKLSANAVKKIRELYEQGVTQAELAKRFGVSQAHISNTVNRKRWTGNDKRVKVHQR